MNPTARFRLTLLALVSTLLLPAGFVRAQDTRTHLHDFIHYVLIAKPELAKAHGQKLLESGLSDAELAELVDEEIEEGRLDRALSRARTMFDLEDTAAAIESRVEQGRLSLARDPERIETAVQMLGGTMRQRSIARDRLEAAGEYAAPALLSQVLHGENQNLRFQAREMLIRIGREAVTPLAESLTMLPAGEQVLVIDILGRIGYPHAAPYLKEIASSPEASPAVRDAVNSALQQIGAGDAGVATLYADLAGRYFQGDASLVAEPTEATNNVWRYDEFAGLTPTPVSTAIYNEVMAMRMAQRALGFEPSNDRALTLYIASDLKRENDLPEGQNDPYFGDRPRSPEFYALAAGPRQMQRVLALALGANDTPLIRDAIAAIESTAGGANLWEDVEASRPLLEALRFPDRRVRYEAALALGKALPRSEFPGSFAVVPTLASAVRAGSASYAVVVAENAEDQTTYTNWLESLGFNVVGFGPSASAVAPQIARAPGVDLVVVRQAKRDVPGTVSNLRTQSRTGVAPVLVVAEAIDAMELRQTLEEDPRVQVKRAFLDQNAFAASVEDVMERTSGGRIDEGQAQIYTIESLATLRDIAIDGATIYDIGEAQQALVEALGTHEGTTRLLVADVLARIGTPSAQQALFDAAFNASGDERVELLRRVAASAKRFGNLADERHLQTLRSLMVAEGGGPAAEASARVYGALNLPDARVVDLIVGGS